jgi:hypothetical protein
MNRRRKEADGPDLRQPEDPSHPIRETTGHKGMTQRTSAHKPGSIDHVMIGTKEKEMEALCFTRRVRRMQVPKGFKLPHDQQKYDGSQEPELWLSDYVQAVKILGGLRATAM